LKILTSICFAFQQINISRLWAPIHSWGEIYSVVISG
jgi:hypothetical protein